MTRLTLLPALVALALLCACAAPRRPAELPTPRRELRAAWVATVANIDWPSQPGLPVQRQQDEARAILDRLESLGFNTVIFQVRPHADALYASALEPWSSYLMGTQGAAPEPYYDPLQFWIDEAHARGLALHAWFNPYRANHPSNRGGIAESSIVKQRPDLVMPLGDKGYVWMDPARREVQDHTTAVILDVVRRYDIDGVHLDDYFYPYPSYNDDRDFPDDLSFEAYRAGGGGLSRSDWRRQNVDTLIERLAREVHRVRPTVLFGISPFGIWRPGHPPGIRGMDQHEVLYADARRWLREGWVDYLSPQLYWPISQEPQSFPVLLGWWRAENVRGRHLWPGASIARIPGEAGATEIVGQVLVTRGMLPEGPGLCHFSMKSLMPAAELPVAERLAQGPYRAPALVPAAPWLDGSAPRTPRLKVTQEDDELRAVFEPRHAERLSRWVLYVKRGDAWTYELLPEGTRERRFESPFPDALALSAVDRAGNEGAVALWPRCCATRHPRKTADRGPG